MKKFLKAAALTGGALFVIKGLDNRLEVTHYNISSEKIPSSFDGFKIAQVSDYHCDSVPGLLEEIKREEPDIIVSTGDLVHDKGSYAPGVRLCGTLMEDGSESKAVELARKYTKANYPDWHGRYPSYGVDRNYLSRSSQMRWNTETFSDALSFQSMTPEELLGWMFD